MKSPGLGYDLAKLREPALAIHDLPTFGPGWIVLLLLLVGFFVLEPLGIPVSAIATAGALILFAVAKRGHAINTGKSAARRTVADCYLLAGDVSGGVWPAQRRADGVSFRRT